MNDNKAKILWITRTAAFIALLIVWQAASAPLGNTLVTGSIVNLLLILSTMTGGILSGIIIAAISPIMAKFVGIGPLWTIIPIIAAGNIVLVLIWHFVGHLNVKDNKYIAYTIAWITAAVAKFLVLYIGIVRIAIPMFLNLPDPQAAAISNTFSIPQLITALIGGALAIVTLPLVERAIGNKKNPKSAY
jgi:hypothetical protein